jgi:hypothetical protein
MPAPYQPQVPYVQDGEPVNAATTNRPTRVVAGNAQYVADRLDGSAIGEASIAYNVTITPALQLGQPVGFDPNARAFVPALAEVANDPLLGVLAPSPRSQCVGILINKTSPTLGDLLIGGRYKVAPFGADPLPGVYYLSSSTPGVLTRQKPPIAAPVLFYDGNFVYFSPTLRDFAEAHTHYAFDLHCAAAGTDTTPGGHHVITSPNAALAGWLPANHASFGGLAPPGAAFGYNLTADTALSAIWPPVPISSLALWWDKGDGAALGGQLLPGGSDPTNISGLWYADQTTLWWLSSCVGDVPWPSSPLPHATSPSTCPRVTAMRLVASFTEMLFATDKSAVTSLTSAEGSPITIVGCSGAPASTGCLELNLDLALLVDDTPTAGATVLKGLTGSTFTSGPVVEALVAGANVTLTPTVGTGAHAQGTVTIDVATDLAGREISPEVVRLGEAKERSNGSVMYLGFPAARASSIRMRFNIPSVGLASDATVAIRLLLLGTATGTLPGTTMGYMRLPRPATNAAVSIPGSDSPVVINTNVAITSGQYIEKQSAPIAVAPGDTLFVTFTRDGGADGYAGELGVIRAAAIIVT